VHATQVARRELTGRVERDILVVLHTRTGETHEHMPSGFVARTLTVVSSLFRDFARAVFDLWETRVWLSRSPQAATARSVLLVEPEDFRKADQSNASTRGGAGTGQERDHQFSTVAGSAGASLAGRGTSRIKGRASGGSRG